MAWRRLPLCVWLQIIVAPRVWHDTPFLFSVRLSTVVTPRVWYEIVFCFPFKWKSLSSPGVARHSFPLTVRLQNVVELADVWHDVFIHLCILLENIIAHWVWHDTTSHSPLDPSTSNFRCVKLENSIRCTMWGRTLFCWKIPWSVVSVKNNTIDARTPKCKCSCFSVVNNLWLFEVKMIICYSFLQAIDTFLFYHPIHP